MVTGAPTNRPATRGVFKYPLDLAPTLVICGAVALGLLPILAGLDHRWLWLIVPLSLVGRALAPVHQHTHGHAAIFRSSLLNALYDHVLVLASGHTTAVWELQHSLGHHRQYLDSRADVAGADRFAFARGWPTVLRRIAFTVCADALTVVDAYQIAAEFPAKRRRLRRRLVLQLAAQLAVLVVLWAFDPVATLAVFIVPNVILRWLVGWIAFAQHDGVPATDTYSGSMNEFGLVSRVLLNLGHHTAHHEKPTLHWSLLPMRTARIFHLIPSTCLKGTPDAGWWSIEGEPR